uniref:B-cell receptor CD22-like isoform X2 n=1 Tax=Scatophagus argus TaxID=75038 RepID=UPI001ED82BB8|nr:B-cell receptor CD22-like isoform X2 [Scatophagus argus]
MHTEQRNLTWTLMPLFLAGILCSTLKVEYQQQHICAVKGSSVVVPCSFHLSDNLTVKRVMWGHVKSHHFKGHFISGSNLRRVASRFQYVGDKQRNCSLKINQVDCDDAGKYAVRFIINKRKSLWPHNVSPTLKVVDLYILVTKSNENGTIKEGNSMNLTCMNGCDGDHLYSAFTWSKNGKPINQGPVLHLSNMSSTNSGNYTCSLNTHTGTTSAAINIDVEYGPKNTSVSVTPSMEVDVGSSVTLICSSHANPPVENYTWFKIDGNDIVDVGHQPVLFSDDGGQYLCSASNKHGSQNSSVVTVKIKPYWATFTRDVLVISTSAVLLIVTAIVVISRLNMKRVWTPKVDCGEDILTVNTDNWLMCQNNQSQDENQCEGRTTELVYITVDFNCKRTSNMEQEMHSDDGEDVIYSTVCGK